MNRTSTFRRNLGLIPLVLVLLASVYFCFGGLIWLTMTVVFSVLAYAIAELCRYDNADPYLFMVVIWGFVMIECGLTPTLLQEYCDAQWSAWIGTIGALVIGATFLCSLEDFCIKEMLFGTILLSCILLWHYYPSVWKGYFWISIVIIAFVWVFFFSGVGAKIVTFSEQKLNIGELTEAILAFCAYEVLLLFLAALLFGWSWWIVVGAFGIGIIGTLFGYLWDIKDEFKTNKNKER